MGINSILQNYYVPTVPSISLEKLQEQNKQAEIVVQSQPAEDIHEEALYSAPERKDAKLEDISLTFNKQERFEYIGQERDVQALDMKKAISDMQKDQILQKYQYFVGSAKKPLNNTSDGTVMVKL